MNFLQTYIVVLATVAELKDKRYYTQIWRVFKELSKSHGLSRRKLIEAISLMFGEGKLIILPTGNVFVMPDLEKIWPMWSDRWFSLYLEVETSGLPKRYCLRHMQRLMLVDLYIRYYYPEKARAIILNMNPQYKDFIKE